MPNIIIDDPNACATSTNITSIILSSTGPWGLNVITGVLTIPNSASILRNQPVWTWDATGVVNELVFTEFDNTTNQYPSLVSSTSSYGERADSFENNGVGLEFIHSDENGGVRPANPNLILNSQSTAGRKYQQYQYFVWVNDDVGRPTHWWSPVSNTWWQIRPLRNNVTVGPDASFDFQTLNAALAYITALPVTAVADDPNQDARQSTTNRWTVILFGQTQVTARIDVQDFINVLFMPGAQIIDSPTSHPGQRMISIFSGDRAGDRTLDAVWSAINPYFGDSRNTANYNIVHYPNSSNGDACAIFISWMDIVSLSDLSIYVGGNGFTPDISGIRVEGDCFDVLSAVRKGIHLNRINVCFEPSTDPLKNSSGFSIAHDSGTCYLNDCQAMGTPTLYDGFTTSAGIIIDCSGTANVDIEECRFQSGSDVVANARNSAIKILNQGALTSTGTIFVSRSDFESYGDLNDGSYAYGIDNGGMSFHSAHSRFAIIQQVTGASATPSASVRYNPTTGLGMRMDACILSGEFSNTDALSLVATSNVHVSEINFAQCVIIGGRYSILVASGTGTLTNARFYGNHIEGAINGTFGAVAATTTYNTSYLV